MHCTAVILNRAMFQKKTRDCHDHTGSSTRSNTLKIVTLDDQVIVPYDIIVELKKKHEL